MSESFTLTRTGQAPLTFSGELLVESDGRIVNGKDHTRWHELAIYRTSGGRYVVAIGYRTQWQGELDRDVAEVVASPQAVVNTLREYDPTAPVAGFPPRDVFAEKQRHLLADVRARYEVQVSEVLAANPEFAEEVD